jgi:cytochrome bd ubiquinol oxidase subunit II
METLWFVIVAVMLTAYVVLDGFDVGAGIVHFLLGRTAEERRLIIKTIGPVWDGNEVWLLAAGGTLYFAFPLLYASSFSGFYLPLIMVLWLLMLRGIGIEFSVHLQSPVWRHFCNVMFSLSSLLLAIFFGAALGNVIRGVPLNAQGYFFEPLWTNFRVQPDAGILDWYTVIAGLVALFALASHGALYIATKTEGGLNQRAQQIAAYAWWGLLVLTPVSLVATVYVRPHMLANYKVQPLGYLIPVIVFGSLALMAVFRARGQDHRAFLTSCIYIAGMLVGAAFGLYPYVLPASTDPKFSLTIYNTAAGQHGLRVGLVWWILGMALALGYFRYLYRQFRGKVTLESDGEAGHGEY